MKNYKFGSKEYFDKLYSFFERKLLILDRGILKKLIRYILSIRFLVTTGQFLTKLVLGRKGITIMYILAQKDDI